MSITKVTTLFYFVTLFLPSQEKCGEEKGCVHIKTHGMVSADCYNGNFRKIPQCLRTDVEILDLTYNRIRKLSKEELGKYKKLKILYLSDNLLTNLDNNTFENLNNLFSLDLSINAIVHLPPSIFRLPTLKRLSLSQNQNINIIETIEEAKPITSPLEMLDISFNALENLPDLGVLPSLLLYNISGNHILDMKVRDIAGTCNLKTLSNTNFSANFHNPCDCWNLQNWLEDRKVEFVKIACDLKKETCPYEISEDDLNTFNDCKSRTKEIERKSSLFIAGIATGVGIIILLLLIGGYILYRRQKNSKRKLLEEKRINAILNGKKESAGLL